MAVEVGRRGGAAGKAVCCCRWALLPHLHGYLRHTCMATPGLAAPLWLRYLCLLAQQGTPYLLPLLIS